MFLFLQSENHAWSLDGIGEVLGSTVVIESDLEAMELCYRPELWDAEFLVCLSEDEEIVGRCHLDSRTMFDRNELGARLEKDFRDMQNGRRTIRIKHLTF